MLHPKKARFKASTRVSRSSTALRRASRTSLWRLGVKKCQYLSYVRDPQQRCLTLKIAKTIVEKGQGETTTNLPPGLPGIPLEKLAPTEETLSMRRAIDLDKCVRTTWAVPCANTSMSSIYKYNCTIGRPECQKPKARCKDIRKKHCPKTHPAIIDENLAWATLVEKQSGAQM